MQYVMSLYIPKMYPVQSDVRLVPEADMVGPAERFQLKPSMQARATAASPAAAADPIAWIREAPQFGCFRMSIIIEATASRINRP
jgi:hypothetical protein